MLRPFLAAATALAVACSLVAQAVQPVGQIHPNARPLNQVGVLQVPVIDRLTISQEDVQRRANGMPARYAIPFAVDANPTSHGTWDTLDATWSLWRLRVQAPNSSHVNLGLGGFFMPAGARMMVYSSDYQYTVRPFDAADHSPTGELWLPVVGTDETVVECYVPTAARDQVRLQLTQVGSGYRFFGAGNDALGLDASGACNVDVVCAQGVAWASEIPAIAAMSSAGSIFCTGAMINNTAQDGRNFFLTANHCGVTAGQAPSLVVYWNYRNTTCGGGGATLTQFTSGSTFRATYAASDFTLVELNSTPNPAWGVTYAGWNRGTGNTTSAVAIHHPSGDAKKISFENNATVTTSYGGTANPGDGTHIRVIDWDTGTTEPGSSGSPLFDPNHRIVGQLHGGSAACGNNLSDYYGRFSVSWTGGGTNASRLSNWLDPIGTGATTLDTLGGVSGTVASATSYGTGCYQSYGAFAQTFAANTFDLGGTAVTPRVIQFVPTTGGYTVQNGTAAWFTPVSANLALGDDALTTLNLPFTFAFPGGSTTAVRMCSNGYVWTSSAQTLADFSPTVAELASGAARLAPAWMDLNPTQGGTTHFDVDPSGTAVYLTWNAVPHYTTGTVGAGNTFQVVLRNTGAVEFRYQAVPNQIGVAVTGWSRGAVGTPPDRDLSATLPLTVTTDNTGLAFNPVNRPLLGTTQTINLANIPAPASSIGLVVVDFANIPAGVDLGIVGAPGCNLYQNTTILLSLFPLAGATVPWNLPIPNTLSLSNSHVYCQGALLVPPGTNAFGLLTSNGVDLLLGTL